jgi:hypothetical protein
LEAAKKLCGKLNNILYYYKWFKNKIILILLNRYIYTWCFLKVFFI